MSIIEWAVILGVSSALIPGPLMAMVVTQTLLKGLRAGIIVACSPFITDAPIIALSLLVVRNIPSSKFVVATIGLCGALYLLHLALRLWMTPSKRCSDRQPPDLLRAVISNVLNPAPYIFWGALGGTILREQLNNSLAHALLFPLIFYVSLVSTKISIALTVGKSESIFSARVFSQLNRAGALAFVAFAGKMLYDAIPNL